MSITQQGAAGGQLSPTASIELLKLKLANGSQDIEDTVRQGRLVATQPSALPLFKGMFRSLDNTYTRYLETWDEIVYLHILSGKQADFPTQEHSSKYSSVKQLYFEACSIHEQYNTLTNSSSTNTANPTQPRTRLPIINLPKFSGNHIDWPLYRDTYVSLIHEESSLTDIEKYHYLVGSLTGHPATLLRSIPFLSANYEQAWGVITQEYNNPRELASTYLNNILDFKPLGIKPTAASLKHFVSVMRENVTSLRGLNIPDLAEYLLFELSIRGLDQATRDAYEFEHVEAAFPRFSTLVDFANERAIALDRSTRKIESHSKSTAATNKTPNRFQPKSSSGTPNKLASTSLLAAIPQTHPTPPTTSTSPSSNQARKLPTCFICRLKHKLTECPSYRSSSVLQRLDLLKSWTGCRNCLFPGHTTNNCTSKMNCRTCQARHHTTLHQSPSEVNSQPIAPSTTSSEVNQSAKLTPSASSQPATFTGVSHSSSQVLLGTVQGLIRDVRGTYHPIRLVLDSGSQHSFLTEEFQQKLQLPLTPCNTAIMGVNNTVVSSVSGKVNCEIAPRDPLLRSVLQTEALVVPTITPYLPQRPVPLSNLYKDIQYPLADPEFHKPGPINFLVGIDLYADILTGAPIALSPQGPRLLPTTFGYVIVGKCSDKNLIEHPIALCSTTKEDSIAPLIHKFWEIEEVNSSPPKLSQADKFCEDHFKLTHTRLPTGRYVVGLPFNQKPVVLGPSKQQALTRFRHLEAKLRKQPDLAHDYYSFLQEYLDLGHMEKATTPGRYIIPHHAVHNKGKLRVVFDASSKTIAGSLNEKLLPGPKLQPDISNILLIFRRYRYAFTADIVKMFRQILVRKEDRQYQHILWKFDQNEQPEEYELTTVTYGLTSSPYLAIRVIRQLVEDEGRSFPLAAEILMHQTYVDDIVAGASSSMQAISLKIELEQLLERGGFKLSKWCTNCPELLKSIQQDTHQTLVPMNTSDDQGVKILGLQWDPNADVFLFKVESPPSVFTKRAILSAIARIYDPLGYLSPITFFAKRILQDIWKLGLNWDDVVPDNILDVWREYLENLPKVKDIKITRHIPLDEHIISCFLIGFCDASQRGYCAAIYLRLDTSNSSQTFLLKAKTKLAPIKPTTIPRLELCSAVLLTQLYESISNFRAILPPHQTYFFTDSTIVLHWLQTPPQNLKTFVANRIVLITDATDSTSWNHVSSEDNPADCGSRGLLPQQLIDHPLWWTGPPWLLSPLSTWPTKSLEPPGDLPELKVSLVTINSHPPYLITWMATVSNYKKLINTMAYLLRFISNVRQLPHNRYYSFITASEFRAANEKIIRIVQQYYYPEAFRSNTVSIKSLLSLDIFKDETGLLRVGGRIHNAPIPYHQKHPILLPKNAHFSKLVVDYLHRSHLHIGPAALLATLRQRYWIPSARQLIKKRLRRCMVCYKMSRNLIKPAFMGTLPPTRFTEIRPFLHTGVDFAGPLACRESARRKAPFVKVYLCLFVCLSTKAIHLELATALSTESFLDALDRFAARRGLPSKMISDCGTNFIGASNYMKEVLRWYHNQQTRQAILAHTTPKGIEWKFNPPSSPHMGGLWEAGIKSAKELIRKTVGGHALTQHELATLLAKVEAVLNSRPLTPLSSAASDLASLTPAHFLIGGPLTAVPEELYDQENLTGLTRWQLLRQRVQYFWERWRNEYITDLQHRRKWSQHRANLQVGELVLLQEKGLPPLQWPLARVVELHPGSDGVVRVVTVRSTTGLYKRHVIKLVSLSPVVDKEK